jgi:hypothetical protein
MKSRIEEAVTMKEKGGMRMYVRPSRSSKSMWHPPSGRSEDNKAIYTVR